MHAEETCTHHSLPLQNIRTKETLKKAPLFAVSDVGAAKLGEGKAFGRCQSAPPTETFQDVALFFPNE